MAYSQDFAVDFFASQELARRKTRLMVVLLVLAVIGLIAGIYLLLLFAFSMGGGKIIEYGVDHTAGSGTRSFPLHWFQPELLLLVSLAVTTIVGMSSAYKIAQLRGGGASVAAMMNARRLLPNSTDVAERRLLNVVEEMAIASGTPVPPVYVLDQEHGINAFAAGYTSDDAIIGVNRGTIEQLNRDELQGVIAHEFSHILNGDMRMSVRMIGILHGIQIISLIGYFIIRSMGFVGYYGSSRSDSRRDGGRIGLLLVGVGLLVLGSVGLFFARLIKASVSRQREYLADASAVQFTRNPDGIGSALKMIGATELGSTVRANNAEVVSHMYFADMFNGHIAHLFATHPPLVPRIQKIDPQFDGDFSDYAKIRARRLELSEQQKKVKEKAAAQFPGFLGRKSSLPGVGQRFPLDPAILIAGVGLPDQGHMQYSNSVTRQIPSPISAAIREVFSARCSALAMLLSNDPRIRAAQTSMIRQREGQNTLDETISLSQSLRKLNPALHLPVFEILQGTLAGMSNRQYEQFRETVFQLVSADNELSLFEFLLRHKLMVYLDRRFGKSPPQRVVYNDLQAVRNDVAAILSLLTRTGHRELEQARGAFAAAWNSMWPNTPPAPVDLDDHRDLSKTSESLLRLGQASPNVKKQILSGCAVAIAFDQKITTEEAELFRAISESLDCPAPPVVASLLQKVLAAADSDPGTPGEA